MCRFKLNCEDQTALDNLHSSALILMSSNDKCSKECPETTCSVSSEAEERGEKAKRKAKEKKQTQEKF